MESTITVNVKGPSELKLSLKIDPNNTIRALKEEIEKQKADFLLIGKFWVVTVVLSPSMEGKQRATSTE